MKIPIHWFIIICLLQFTLGGSAGYSYYRDSTEPQCYKPTFADALHTWHPIKCPKGLGVIR